VQFLQARGIDQRRQLEHNTLTNQQPVELLRDRCYYYNFFFILLIALGTKFPRAEKLSKLYKKN